MTTVIFSHSSGNNSGSLHFIWKLPSNATETEITSGNASTVHKVQPLLPSFHTRAMRKQFYNVFSLFQCARPAVMHEMYRKLKGVYMRSTNNVYV